MALLREEKQQIINHFKTSELDTGSSEVQIALLTFRIKALTEHFKENKKDFHGRLGLVKLVNRRRKLLDYLKRSSSERYTTLIKELGIRK
ncbi:MAG: 30S ribosomal protein S15 [Bdellovibrionales bacterium]|nr:30S ribosomal protein S15 [Bdellovibrionales bacterium]